MKKVKFEMSVQTAKYIRLILLIFASVCFIVGVSMSREAEKKAATDVSRISVQITDKDCCYNQDEYCYNIDFTYKITNKAKVDWCYLEIKTYVYDKSGEQLGTLTSKIGSQNSSSDFRIKKGKTLSKDVTFSSDYPDTFFKKMYDSDFSDLKFESEVTYGVYLE